MATSPATAVATAGPRRDGARLRSLDSTRFFLFKSGEVFLKLGCTKVQSHFYQKIAALELWRVCMYVQYRWSTSTR